MGGGVLRRLDVGPVQFTNRFWRIIGEPLKENEAIAPLAKRIIRCDAFKWTAPRGFIGWRVRQPMKSIEGASKARAEVSEQTGANVKESADEGSCVSPVWFSRLVAMAVKLRRS
jgi:hypothetical protein